MAGLGPWVTQGASKGKGKSKERIIEAMQSLAAKGKGKGKGKIKASAHLALPDETALKSKGTMKDGADEVDVEGSQLTEVKKAKKPQDVEAPEKGEKGARSNQYMRVMKSLRNRRRSKRKTVRRQLRQLMMRWRNQSCLNRLKIRRRMIRKHPKRTRRMMTLMNAYRRKGSEEGFDCWSSTVRNRRINLMRVVKK